MNLSNNIVLILCIVAAILSMSLYSVISNIKNSRKIKERLEKEWGNKLDRKYTSEDISYISKFFHNKKCEDKDKFFIDEITWNDLEMDEIFKYINSTDSTPGEECFYAMLREPIYDEMKLKNRNKLIEFFQNNEEERKKIQYRLAKLGKRRGSDISSYFCNDTEENEQSKLIIYRILGIIPLVSIGIMFLNSGIGLMVLILSFMLNMALHYYVKKRIDYKLRAYSYIIQMIKCSNLILKENVNEIEYYNNILKNAVKVVKQFKNVHFDIDSNGSDASIIITYINMVFLKDLINYEKMNKKLKNNDEEFKTIFEVLGIIDSAVSIASYRCRVKNYTIPELYKCNNKKEQDIVIKDVRHPLIPDGVANSIDISDSILITGSNASGKSTFLKTVAINCIFAQTIYTCTASEFKMSYLKIYTSMALRDNILSKESYYIAETKSLKRIIDSIDENIPTICFIDEILRGTNTVERIAASSQVLKYLTLSNCICIAATHDVELTYILEKYFKNYHFQENIIGDDISFDYKVHNGRSTTQNAIKLLGILGYKEDIVKKAEQSAKNFLNGGVWKAE